jgi:hypothetical protein
VVKNAIFGYEKEFWCMRRLAVVVNDATGKLYSSRARVVVFGRLHPHIRNTCGSPFQSTTHFLQAPGVSGFMQPHSTLEAQSAILYYYYDTYSDDEILQNKFKYKYKYKKK